MKREVVAAAHVHLSEAHEPIDAPMGPVPFATPDDPTDQQRQLDELSGYQTYTAMDLQLGRDLTGRSDGSVALSLAESIRLAVANNLDAHIARIVPRISQQQIVEAEAAFDPAAFAEATYNRQEQPLAARSVSGNPIETEVLKRNTADINLGLRKRLESGGEVSVSTGLSHVNDQSPETEYTPDPGSTVNATVSLSHPLLRNFGRQANLAQVQLATNATARDQYELQKRLLSVVAETESAYWQLVLARYQLAIRQALLDQTIKTYEELKGRAEVDASPLQIAQAASFVELRQSDLVSAQRALRDASDQLKMLMNADDLPLVAERVIEPTDRPSDRAVQRLLSESIRRGLEHRPEVHQALLNIDDAWVRQAVAENQKLPQLDLTAQMQMLGLDEDVDESYGEIGDGEFIDWLVGLRYEQPLGNRAAEAVYQQQVLARQAHVLGYRRAARDVTLSVKQALRAEQNAYELITITRRARRATAQNLRTLQQREEAGQELTPEFLLDLKLSTQQRLAEAELREVRAIIEYNIARTQYLQATGELLTAYGVDLSLPEGHAQQSWPTVDQP
jgi:outer membrane protein TolC